jgi:tRNA-Thr(GGU) m(6)t(6)A37 methyltransferase TsaA
MPKTLRILLVVSVCLLAGGVILAITKAKGPLGNVNQTCHLSGPLAARLMAAGSGADGDAEYYLVSLGLVKRQEGKTLLVLKDKYAPGLVSLGDFSHVMVFYWFDRNDTPEKRSFLQGYRQGKEDPLTGVFATRSAARPNLIAMTTCRIISVTGNIVEIDRIDAFDDTPILDLKPYIPRNDSFPTAQIPVWVSRRPAMSRTLFSLATATAVARADVCVRRGDRVCFTPQPHRAGGPPVNRMNKTAANRMGGDGTSVVM